MTHSREIIAIFCFGMPFDLMKEKLITMITTRNNTSNRVITNVFDELFNVFPYNWGNETKFSTSAVPVNIHEDAQGYHLEVNSPGRKKEDFSINLEQNLLTISTEVKEETEQTDYKTIRREFKASTFKRSFTLDNKINADGIEAKYENGILKVFLPKKEEVKDAPKQITIQ